MLKYFLSTENFGSPLVVPFCCGRPNDGRSRVFFSKKIGVKQTRSRSQSFLQVHFSVNGYSSNSGTWAPADRLPGIRMHLPDARCQSVRQVVISCG